MDEFTQESIINISTSAIRDFMRTHNLPQWPPEDYWWFGLMHAWGFPWWRLDKGKPISISVLSMTLTFRTQKSGNQEHILFWNSTISPLSTAKSVLKTVVRC